jgi:transposase-like protein
MKTTFNSKLELVRYYANEENCKALLAQQRWGASVSCPHCGNEKVYTTNRGYKCANKECYKKFTVISGTIFENTKIQLNKWFEAIFVISAHKKGISSHQLAKDIAVSQKTAWFILHRVREMLKSKNSPLLSGTVQIDETYVGGKLENKHKSQRVKAKPGRGSQNKTMVFGVLQNDGSVHSQVVRDTKTSTLIPIMESQVEKGSTIVTDGYHIYKRLAANYNHVVVDHSKDIYVSSEGLHTNSIEGYWSQLKRGIYGIYHQVSPDHLHRYCNEFSFRYNSRKKTDVERFTTILTLCSGRLTWNQLTEKTSQ